MKKKLLIIGLVFGLSFQLFSQTTNDQKAIVEKVFKLIETQENPQKISSDQSPLFILDNGIISTSLNFERSVVFSTKENLQRNNIETYLEFITIDFSNEKLVHVIFNYVIKNEIKVNRMLQFEKQSEKWILTETTNFD